MNLARQLVEAVKRHSKRVTVIGDAMTDCYIHGRLEPCQDGCPKFIEEGRHMAFGGAANAEQCLRRWDVNCGLFTYAYADWPYKFRYLYGDALVFRHDLERGIHLTESAEWARRNALAAIQHADAVLLSDYDKGFLTPEFIREVVDLCADRKIPCVADCKRAPEVYEGCILKGNGIWGVHNGMGWNPPGWYVETHGDYYPGVWESGGWVATEIPDLSPVRFVNHVGAGDCFAAHLTLALTYGFSLKDAATIAHSAGRVYVQHAHNRAPYPDEVAADMDRRL